MNAETGYGVEEQPTPIRPSGFFTLLLGLLSTLSVLGRPLLVLPVLTILLGLFALRPSGDRKPIGGLAAKLGLILAVGFGAAGFCVPWFAAQKVGSEASYFSEQYLRLIAQDDRELAMEMRKDHINRAPARMSLVAHYAQMEADAKEKQALTEMETPLESYEGDEGVASLKKVGPDIDLVETKSPRLYSRFGEEMVDTFWNNTNDPFNDDLIVTMTYKVDAESGLRQWYVKRVMTDQDQPIAEANY